MIEEDAGAHRDRVRRRTWLTGGILLVSAALLYLVSSIAAPMLRSAPIGDLCFAVAVFIFAIGLGKAGSVTARRPMGTGALIAFVIWWLAYPKIMALMFEPEAFGWIPLYSTLSITALVVALVLAVIAVVQIARIAVVPAPWNWAPLWALCVVVLGQVINALPIGAVFSDDQNMLIAFSGLLQLVGTIAMVFLGVVAIVLAARPTPDRTVPIFTSPSQ